MAFEKRNLPKKSENLADWYNRVVLLTELADYGPAKGTMVFRPYGYALWENIQKELDKDIKAKGVKNAYFPLFIPESLLKKEKAHVEGFSPELAVVTIGGGEELKEKLVVRPTSETIMYHMYAKWIESWRDLPMLINQWNNVVRWEKRTYLFLRTAEFLWQEGHTAHTTHEEAWEMVLWAMNAYEKLYREFLAMPGCTGKKSESEKFAGAATTITYETLMPEGKALQSCTSHDLGQNFSKPFDIKFQNKEGMTDFVWQTSWGLSTRSIGGMLMMHGDDLGLRLPPRIAPIQVIILPVKVETDILQSCDQVLSELKSKDIRAEIDSREDETLGYKINKWELKGIPLRIEIGPKEIEKQSLSAIRRDNGKRINIPLGQVAQQVSETLENIQTSLYRQAETFLNENTREASDYKQFKKIMATTKGFIKAFWCENPECEAKIKEETKATPRCLPLEAKEEKGQCLLCGGPAKFRWLFGQSY
jgi:prolyl-tRNA synthetase